MANLSGASLGRASLIGTNLSNADLREVGLGRSFLRSVHLNGARLGGADFSDADAAGIEFVDVDLSAAKGLETICHMGPSSVGIDTIYKSHGKIPEVFLRGCGVPDEFIAYIGSMVGRNPIEYLLVLHQLRARGQAVCAAAA